jgi:hypothetical protein
MSLRKLAGSMHADSDVSGFKYRYLQLKHFAPNLMTRLILHGHLLYLQSSKAHEVNMQCACGSRTTPGLSAIV